MLRDEQRTIPRFHHELSERDGYVDYCAGLDEVIEMNRIERVRFGNKDFRPGMVMTQSMSTLARETRSFSRSSVVPLQPKKAVFIALPEHLAEVGTEIALHLVDSSLHERSLESRDVLLRMPPAWMQQ